MKVSIVIPFFNQVATARWTWRSAVEQTYRNLEVVLVNDGSTDENDAWHARLLAREWSNVRYLEQENQGVVAARNAGVRAATGEALLFLDADDWIDRTFVEQTIHLLDERQDIGVVSTQMHVFSENEDSIVETPVTALAILKDWNTIPNTSLIKRRAFEEAGGYKSGVYEDWELWLSVLAKGWRHAVVHEPLLHYRSHPQGSRISCLIKDHDALTARMKELHPEVYGA